MIYDEFISTESKTNLFIMWLLLINPIALAKEEAPLFSHKKTASA